MVAAAALALSEKDIWVVDSGATHTLVNDVGMLSNPVELPRQRQLRIKGIWDHIMVGTHSGSYQGFARAISGALVPITINNVYFVPELGANLYSSSATHQQQNYGMHLFIDEHNTPQGCISLYPAREVIMLMSKPGTWLLETQRVPDASPAIAQSATADAAASAWPFALGQATGVASAAAAPSPATSQNTEAPAEAPAPVDARLAAHRSQHMRIMHERLGHCHDGALDQWVRRKLVDLPSDRDREFCVACAEGKHRHTAMNKEPRPAAENLLDEVGSDIVGPIRPAGLHGEQHFVIFV
jgi:hypothetical protein